MTTVTVVRNLTGTQLELPSEVFVRPWHFVELNGETSDETRTRLRELSAAKAVQVDLVVDGKPMHRSGL